MIFGTNCLRAIKCVLAILLVWGGVSFGMDEELLRSQLVDVEGSSEKEWNAQVLLENVSRAIPPQVSYEETHVSAILTTPIVSHGTLSFIPPSRLEKHVLSPREERYVIVGNSLQWEEMTTGHTKKLFLPDYPLLQTFVEGFRAVFAGDLATLKTRFAIELVGTKDAWKLKLTPIDENFVGFVDALHFMGQGERITGIEIREARDDYSHIAIAQEGM